MNRRLSIIALTEWVLVMPAALILIAAPVRSMGGRGLAFRIAQFLYGWITASFHRPVDAAVMFVLLPLACLSMGAATPSLGGRLTPTFVLM